MLRAIIISVPRCMQCGCGGQHIKRNSAFFNAGVVIRDGALANIIDIVSFNEDNSDPK